MLYIEVCMTLIHSFIDMAQSTLRYDEIIESETDFLINNFSDEVEHAFNTVLYRKEYHSRTLVFALKMLRGGDVKTAWEMANLIAVV